MSDRSWVIALKMPDSPPNGNRPNAVLRMIAFVGLFEGAVDAMTVEIALRLRPESVQAEVGRVEGLFGLPLAFRLTPVILAESRLPGDGEHVGGRHPLPSSGALNGRSAGGRMRRRLLGRLATADLNPTFAGLGSVDGDEIMCGVWFVFADEQIAMAGFELDVARIGPLADRLQGRARLGSDLKSPVIAICA